MNINVEGLSGFHAPIAGIGDNNPPEPTPYELVRGEIDDLFAEAKHWLDGEPVSTPEMAEAIQKLMRQIQAAATKAEAARVDENKPFDEGKAEVQARYNTLIGKTTKITGKTVMAVDLCKQALTPWLNKLEAERQAKAEAARIEAEKARLEVERLAKERATLDGKEAFELAAANARKLEATANKIENSTAKVGGEGRAISMRDYYSAKVVQPVEFARYLWQYHKPDYLEWLEGFAAQLVAAGKRDGIAGVEVIHEKRPV
jgi:hypothetical protein